MLVYPNQFILPIMIIKREYILPQYKKITRIGLRAVRKFLEPVSTPSLARGCLRCTHCKINRNINKYLPLIIDSLYILRVLGVRSCRLQSLRSVCFLGWRTMQSCVGSYTRGVWPVCPRGQRLQLASMTSRTCAKTVYSPSNSYIRHTS